MVIFAHIDPSIRFTTSDSASTVEEQLEKTNNYDQKLSLETVWSRFDKSDYPPGTYVLHSGTHRDNVILSAFMDNQELEHYSIWITQSGRWVLSLPRKQGALPFNTLQNLLLYNNRTWQYPLLPFEARMKMLLEEIRSNDSFIENMSLAEVKRQLQACRKKGAYAFLLEDKTLILIYSENNDLVDNFYPISHAGYILDGNEKYYSFAHFIRAHQANLQMPLLHMQMHDRPQEMPYRSSPIIITSWEQSKTARFIIPYPQIKISQDKKDQQKLKWEITYPNKKEKITKKERFLKRKALSGRYREKDARIVSQY